MNKFKVVELKMNLLNRLYEVLESEERDLRQTFKETGERKPKIDWETNKEVIDEETGEVVMRDVWGYFDKEEDEYSDEDKCKLAVIEELKRALEKLA